MPTAIRVENLGKKLRLSHQAGQYSRYRTLREGLGEAASGLLRRARGAPSGPKSEDFWALKDVDFEIPEGEVVGIIGKNGAGKSTLLKILSRITSPTTGRAELRGRVGSLLEVGTGFHPELTGRENIYLNGSILGMYRREIARKFDEIVAFAGVERFLDTPVKRYSSGMFVRLAFAVAANLEPEILLVDEVLAVGDQEFQKKCIGKMGDIATSGRTVLLVSHNLPMLSRLSEVVIWLDRGGVQRIGEPGDVVDAYCQAAYASGRASSSVSLSDHPGRRAGKEALLSRVSLLDPNEAPTLSVPLGGTLVVEVELGDFARRSDHNLVLEICDTFGTVLAHVSSQVVSGLDLTEGPSRKARCFIEDIRLVPGEYRLNVLLGDCDDYLDRVEGAISFIVEPHDVYGTGRIPSSKFGMFAPAARWSLEGRGAPRW